MRIGTENGDALAFAIVLVDEDSKVETQVNLMVRR
jgi:hypothetical protein